MITKNKFFSILFTFLILITTFSLTSCASQTGDKTEVMQDDEMSAEVKELFQKAVQGDPEAQVDLGYAYSEGKGSQTKL